MATLPPREEMQRAYLSRNTSYDGIFFLGVRSTGIFCRPSCGARKPKPSNVEFFGTSREAVFAGYRPCKRCRPMMAIGKAPVWVERLLAEVERDPTRRITDATIRSLGIDPSRVRRYFQKTVGMTFQTYCRGRRLGGALQEIRDGARLDDVVLGHGFESHSGFRDAFMRTFGTPPGKARSTESILFTWIESPLGALIAGATPTALVLLEFTDRRMLPAQIATVYRLFKRPIVPGENPILLQLKTELAEYFEGKRKRFTIPLDFPGSEFQREVWQALLQIPYGETMSYEQLAQTIGKRNAQRAVGHSNGLNRLAIVVPCHRIIQKNGTLGGYGGGVWRKQALLDLERGERLLLGADETAGTHKIPESNQAGFPKGCAMHGL